jgi:hypothetical protein
MMSTTNQSPLDALSGLLEERKRYEGWLAHLDSRRGEAPPHILDKVRGDYLARLRSVTEQLRGRASYLESSAADLGQRIEALRTEEAGHLDTRAETALRAAVGEFELEFARDQISRCDEAVARLREDREAASTELTKVQDVLAMIHAPEARHTPAGAAPVAPPADPAPVPNQGGFDELAFLQSVVQPGVARHIPSESVPAQIGSPTPAPRDESSVPTAQMTEAAQGVTTQPALSGARRTAAVPGARESFGGTQTAAAFGPDGMPAFFKDVPAEQVKTLKCQECGTMNYPTEWYCERCGGELAAM